MPLTHKPIVINDSIVSRFWNHVEKSGDCWEWLSSVSNAGYGRFTIGRKTMSAHRVSYAIAVGDPGDSLVCHKCDNPSCVNPYHLFLGSHKDNTTDMIAKGRHVIARGADVYNAILDEEAVSRARRDYKTGMYTFTELAANYNVSRRSMSDAIKGENWKHVGSEAAVTGKVKRQKPYGNAGESHYRSKLKQADVDKIRDEYNSGVSQREIARKWNIDFRQVHKIVKNKVYRSK